MILSDAEGFEWDYGNLSKNWEKHNVHHSEAEEIFFNDPLVVISDDLHSAHEARYYALGKTDAGRRLFIVFAKRNKKIRIISARGMSKSERKWYK